MEVNLEESVQLNTLTDPNSSISHITYKNRSSNNYGSDTVSQQEFNRSKMMASTETMGTIEPIGSTTDMSMLMGSSTFSLFRHGNESTAVMEESGTTGTTTSTGGATAGSLMQRGSSNQGPLRQQLQRQNSNNHSQFMSQMMLQPSHASKSSSKTSSSLESNSSLHFSDIMNNNYSSSMANVMGEVRRQLDDEGSNAVNIHDSSNYIYDETGTIATLPRTIGVMMELPDETASTSNQNSTNDLDMMGSSSLAVLQSALLRSTNSELQDDADGDDNDVDHGDNADHEL
jgi:hypothetical protein